MKTTSLTILIALLPLLALAQSADDVSFQENFLLRNVTGTMPNPGPAAHHPQFLPHGDWTLFREGAVFATYVTESGPEEQRDQVLSTNWFAGGAQRSLGDRGLVLFRGRVSLEPLTIAEEGAPQLLQVVQPGISGGPRLDYAPPQPLIGEVAAHLAFRAGSTSFFHLYAAPVGNPALGAVPYAQRLSSEEFAESPFAYDVAEAFQHATRVVTAGFGSRYFGIEGGVFHNAVSTGRRTSLGDGDIDSWSGRLVVTPTSNLSIQLSSGKLGEETAAGLDRTVTTASISHARHARNSSLATTGLWVRDERYGVQLEAMSIETTLRIVRNSFSARIEAVDRPAAPAPEETIHFTIGYIYDFIARGGWRGGVGVNVDYHTRTHDVEHRYGHKPQAIFAFIRLRTDLK